MSLHSTHTHTHSHTQTQIQEFGPQNTTKMAGVTQAKPWFTESGVFTTPILETGIRGGGGQISENLEGVKILSFQDAEIL